MIFVSVLTPAELREERCLDRLMEIWLNGNLEAHSFIPGTYWEDNVPAVREQIALAEIFVCESDGEMGEVRAGKREILGFAGMAGDYLAGIFVDGEYRSRGVGKQLLEQVKRAHPSFSLHVYEKNRRAVEFYRREGLLEVSRQTDGENGETEILMEWKEERT